MNTSISLYNYQGLRQACGKGVFKDLRNSFVCSRNPDVAFFIKEECTKYEKAGNTRNYFYFDKKNNEIAAYFTLSLHSLIISDLTKDLDPETLTTICGYGKRDALSVGCYLIGQLARSDKYARSDISGEEILQEIKTRIATIRQTVGGRFITVDCEDALIPFYERNGFTKVNKKGSLNTMIMPIIDF